MPAARIVDEQLWGFGWLLDEPYERCSHALCVDGRVWLIDPVEADGLDERIAELGEPAGVIQLLDRHTRDCEAFARRLGVEHHVVPREPLQDAPFRFLVVRKGWTWDEVALWWPRERVLACGDALGTGRFFVAEGERLAVHPLLRLLPPRRRLGSKVSPWHVLCGHGAGVHEDEAEPAFREALASSRRRVPAWLGTLWRQRGGRRT